MKSKKVIYVLVLVLFMLANLYLLANNVFIRMNGTHNPDGGGSALGNLKEAHYLTTMVDLYENSGIRLQNVSLTDVDSRRVSDISQVLDSIPDGSAVLVCRFTQYDCELCVSYAIEKVFEYVKMKNIHMFIWGNYDTDNALRALRYNLKSLDNVRWFNVPELAIPIDQHGNPYYMVINKEGYLTDFFTPDKMDPRTNDMFFSTIDTKFGSGDRKWY